MRCARSIQSLAGGLAAFFLCPLAGQAASTPSPGAGSILQQIEPVQPPAAPNNDPGLTIEQPKARNPPPTALFLVKRIRIEGNAAFDTARLHSLVRDSEGKNLSLPELYALAAVVTDYYHRHGYLLARAVVPAQTIQDGEVEIDVIEAHYDKIELDNRSRVNDSLLQATLLPLRSGQAIEQSSLDRSLLLLSDVPGAVSGATLKPGDTVGTSDLLVQIAPGPAVTGDVTVDNYGNRYTGAALIGAGLDLYDLMHHGDVVDAAILSSGPDMEYGKLSWDVLMNGAGAHLGASYSALHYILGDSLTSLDGHGTAGVASLWAKQPLLRTVAFNLYGELQFDRKQLRDEIDVSGIHTDRHLDNWTASLSGDERDALLSGAISTWSLGLTSGQVGFDNAAAERADAATAKIQGLFFQANAAFVRLQKLTPHDALYLSLSGQWASTNLDPAQKMVAGGPYTVRAYEMSASTGDSGIQSSAEWRHDLRASHGQWQTVLFVDSQHVTVNRNVWSSGMNNATLSGAGVGMNWAGPRQWTAKASLAAPVGSTPVLVGTASRVRAWVELEKGF